MADDNQNNEQSLVPPNMRRLIKNIETTNNIYSLDSEERADWIELLNVEDLVQEHKNPEVVFFVGCVYSYDPKLMQVAADTVKLLDAAHVSFVVLGDREVCCGAPYFLN
ncbi:MAG: heterodisulfide reductase-related iron-sulfur binding cluster, partial [Candidatus Ranarchaeia archaeon]